MADMDGTTQSGVFGKVFNGTDTGTVTAPEVPELRPVLQSVGGSTTPYYAGCVDLPGAYGVFGFPAVPGDPSTLAVRDFAFETWVVRLDGPTIAKKDLHPPDPKTLNQPLVAGYWSWGFAMTTQPAPAGEMPSADNIKYSTTSTARAANPPTFITTVRPAPGSQPTGALLHYRTHVRQYCVLPTSGPITGSGGFRSLYFRITEQRWR